MKRVLLWSIVILGLGLCVLIVYYGRSKPPAATAVQPRPPVAVKPPAPAEPQIRYPLPQLPPEKPLPALDVSDSTMRNALSELTPGNSLIEYFLLKNFVRRIVATVDNLPREKLAPRLIPVKPPSGKFLVRSNDTNLTIDPDNAARYAPYLRLADALDTSKLVALYIHFYPLFQQAYQELGYPQGYFNDRLVAAIDNLLAAPVVDMPVKLVRPKVFYLYADPALENRSAGQKILMRMGNDNAAHLKEKLREIRGELIRQPIKR